MTAKLKKFDLSQTKNNPVETLVPDRIVKTIRKLHQRIGERFPDSGLQAVCLQLATISENMVQRAEWIGRPVTWIRALTWAICALIIFVTMLPFYFYATPVGPNQTEGSFTYTMGEDEAIEGSAKITGFDFSSDGGLVDFVTLLEAGINDVVLIGAAIFFLLSFETRYKRQRALKALHELRSIAHVIDMHQLTKDPHRIMKKMPYASTGGSPRLEMTEFQLRRYLDYCSEMLSLTGKIAAVYVQEFDDGVAMASASELETLTTGLSGKIWQKIAILHTAGLEDVKKTETIVPTRAQPRPSADPLS